jgi:hypothetical protein
VALAIFAPHAAWLRSHDFSPIRYALETSLGVRMGMSERLFGAVRWLADQVFNRGLPALILLALAGRWCLQPVATRADEQLPLAPVKPPAGDAARALLLCWGVVPLLFMTLVGVLTGADLQLQWGTPFLLFVGPAAMEVIPGVAWNRLHLRKVVASFIAIQTGLLTLSYVTSPLGPIAFRDRHWRAFDSQGLEERISTVARLELAGPIRLVSGDGPAAAALSLRLPERPLVLIDGRYDRSPWVDPELVRRCGAVQLGSVKTIGDGRWLGPDFPDLVWRSVGRDPAAPPCATVTPGVLDGIARFRSQAPPKEAVVAW